MPDEINCEVARQLGEELFNMPQPTLAAARTMMVKYRKKNQVAIQAPKLYAMIRLLVGRTGPIARETREKLKALFLKLDELEGE